MREKDREFLRRVVAGGVEGINMGMGDTSATKRLTSQGLVRWEQAHPFIARVYATEAGLAADTEPEGQRFFCNKCGYSGPTEQHQHVRGCRYLAVPMTEPEGDERG